MDLRDIRENLNCNFIRPGQYISAPYVYDLCDKIGLISCGEFPNVKDLDFSLELQESHARELIRQYRNHPSILLWDVGDESNRAADSRWVFEEDNTRYITCRDCPGPASGKFINLPSEELRLSKMLNCNVRGWYDDDEMNIRPENQQQATNEQHRHERARRGYSGTTSNNRIDQRNLVVWLYEDHGCDRRYQNAPLLFYNPKGWVDSYRIPKFSYYLWQANYAEKPMVFIHLQFWRKQYIGQTKDIEVDSNCESIELKINDKSFGTKYPNKENFHVVKFENVPIENGKLTAIGMHKGVKIMQELKITGEAAKISLKSSHLQLTAAQNSVAIITADILDKENSHIYGARNTLKWEVSGPAVLVGHSLYQSDFEKRMDTEGVLYIDAPASNVIRSTGEPGTIIVRVFAAGLKMGEVKIQAVKASEISDNLIYEVNLTAFGREKTARNPKEGTPDVLEISPTIRPFSRGFKIGKNQNSHSILTQNFKKINPNLDTKSDEFSLLIGILSKTILSGNGTLSASESNYNVENFNRFSALKKIIQATKLNERAKKDWTSYFTDYVVKQGNDINITLIKSRLESVSDFSVTVIPGSNKIIPDVISTKSLELDEIITQIFPKFTSLNESEKENYLSYLCTINPWIKRIYYFTGDSKLGNRQEHISYQLTPEKAIILPEIQLKKK